MRSRISGTPDRPRLSVYRSNKHVIAQLIDDLAGHTLVGMSDGVIKIPKGKRVSKVDKSRMLGSALAKEAQRRNIKKAVFDRGGYAYHGRTRALAEGAREGGLTI